MTINISIDGAPQEIAALALELQGRQPVKVDFGDGTLSREIFNRVLRPAAGAKCDTPPAEPEREQPHD